LDRSKDVLEGERLTRALGEAGEMGAGEAWAPAKRAPRTGAYLEKSIVTVVKLVMLFVGELGDDTAGMLGCFELSVVGKY
jgi:hypothetical protein